MSDHIKTLVVDDSPTMRRIIRASLETDPRIHVVGEAPDAPSARDLLTSEAVDVVTLDVEMPGMDGIEFLDRIMRYHPLPVIMVSTHTQKGARATVEALARGAFGCVGKPTLDTRHKPFDGLIPLIHAAADANLQNRKAPPTQHSCPVPGFKPNGKVVVIGASIGGVEALSQILAAFPENCPPTLITQHMPKGYTESFAERLDRKCAPRVQEAADGMAIKAGHVYLAPGGDRHLEVKQAPTLHCTLVRGPKVSGHSPSIDRLFSSGAALGPRGMGVILTGMGRDGAQGLLQMRQAGAHTVSQSADTCVVPGIVKAATHLGAVLNDIALHAMADHILTTCNAGAQT
ncbi:MAG: chemotaxis response regulator protein-glutamate methylesterase [Pseudomonadota bacterium]